MAMHATSLTRSRSEWSTSLDSGQPPWTDPDRYGHYGQTLVRQKTPNTTSGNVEHCWRAGATQLGICPRCSGCITCRPWRIVLQNAPIMLCHNSLKIPLLCLGLVLHFKTVETSLVREGRSCWNSLAVERHSYLPTLPPHAHVGSGHQSKRKTSSQNVRVYARILGDLLCGGRRRWGNTWAFGV